jgi:hypothetical protein
MRASFAYEGCPYGAPRPVKPSPPVPPVLRESGIKLGFFARPGPLAGPLARPPTRLELPSIFSSFLSIFISGGVAARGLLYLCVGGSAA